MKSQTITNQLVTDCILNELVNLLLTPGRLNGIYGFSLGLKHNDRLFIHSSTILQVLGERLKTQIEDGIHIDLLLETLSSVGWLEQQCKDKNLPPRESLFTVRWDDVEQRGYRDFEQQLITNKWYWMIILKWPLISDEFGKIPNIFFAPTDIWPSQERKRRFVSNYSS